MIEPPCIALVALAALLGGVGCGESGAPSPTRTPVAKSAAGTTSVPGPTPRIVFHSPQRHGYRFAVAPLVVKLDPDEFTLFLRMNKRLPGEGGSEGVEYANALATVNGTFSGFGVATTSYKWDPPKPCYSATMDIQRRATVPPGKVKVGQRVTVRLYIAAHRAPLEVQVALAPRARGEADTPDPTNLYLRQIGCRRSPAAG
jgi:hypothetical protein